MSDARPVPVPPRPGPPAAAPVPGSAPVPPGVASALAALETVAGRPLPEHVEVYDAVHRQLQDALAALDEG